MGSRILLPAMLCLSLAGCAGDDTSGAYPTYELNPASAASLNAAASGSVTQANTRPFIPVQQVEDFGDGRPLTLDQYINALYLDVLRRPASSDEVASAVNAYASGATIQQVVSAIFSANPGVQGYVQNLQAQATTIPSSDARGFDNTDFLLYYLILQNDQQQQLQNVQFVDYLLPYVVNSQQYYTYLLADYLIR